MRGRRAGRIGLPFGPLVGKAGGIFHLAEVLLARKAGGWPIVTAPVVSGGIAAAVKTSPTAHVQFAQVKVDGGTLA